MVQSRRKSSAVTTKTGMQISEAYCRKCCKMKKPNEFYSAVDLYLDGNGLMSICKECCQQIYNGFYLSEKSIERAMLKTCRLLNLKYDENAIEAAKQQIETMKARGTESDNFFGLYKARLLTSMKLCIQDDRSNVDLTFQEDTPAMILSDNDIEFQNTNYDLKYFWGSNLTEDDYIFLENEMAAWKGKHKCDTRADETLLKEICLAILDIRKKRESDQPTAKQVEDLQKLMKTAGVDPSKASSANSGKAQETFSSFIKTIEENEPADYFKDKDLFKDFDNIDFYFKKYVTRPLKNFITQSRDFNVDTEDSDDELIEDEIIEDGE